MSYYACLAQQGVAVCVWEEATNFGIDFDIQNGEYTCIYIYVHMCIQYARGCRCVCVRFPRADRKMEKQTQG